LEDNGFVTRTLAICKCTYSLGRFVRETGKKIIESFMTKGLHEPFAIKSQFMPYRYEKMDAHIRSRELFQSVEAETCIFN